nr:V-type proton ATPase subunit C isoform X3 [Drosophila takahashii]
MMSEYWIISAPGDKTCQQTYDTMNNLTSKQHNLCNNYKFHIPDLKVGTLDQLVGLSDDLGKLDTYVEQITRKVANYLGEVLEDQRDKLHENLMANNTELPQYLTRFQWDMAKYPIKQSLRNIADIISKQIGQIDGDLKTKSQAYNNLKGNLQNLEKKKTGSLLTRNLADLVKKEHFILDSEYLTTLLVIVPKVMANEWLTNYEKITDMIVPRSSQLIQEDSDYCLFNVTLFKKVAEEFKLHARERKFIVRDFVYNEEELAAGKNEMTKLMTDKKKQFVR